MQRCRDAGRLGSIKTDRETDRHRVKQIEINTDKQTDKQTVRLEGATYMWLSATCTYIHIYIHTYIHTETGRKRDKQTNVHAYVRADRQADRRTSTKRGRHAD